MPDAPPLRVTPLNAVHRAMGARMVDFGGWEMPVQYTGIIEEHCAVRTAAGLFDVSHMGEIEIRGPEAGLLADYVTTNAATRLQAGRIQYSALLYDHGGFADDILVHKVAGDRYFLCVNASNQDKDFAHISAHNRFDATVENAGERYAQLALQGPRALATLQKLTPAPLAAIRNYHFVDGEVSCVPARIARTGYTGEDGFEIYFPPADAGRLWKELLDAGRESGVKPVGLGARNTLRLEAKMALYGHEIDASISPLEAGLEWIVKFDKGGFIGRDALLKQKESGVRRKPRGLKCAGGASPATDTKYCKTARAAGWVTSGSYSPTLNKNIGLCYLPAEEAQPGRSIQIAIRSQPVDAVTVETPFYKRRT